MIDLRSHKPARIAVEALAVVVAFGVCSVWYVRGAGLLAQDYWREAVS